MIVHKKRIRFAMEKIALVLSLVLCAAPKALSQSTSANDKNPVYCLAASRNKIFAGSDHGVFVTTNKGSSWTAASAGLTSTDVRALAVSGTNLFAGTPVGVYLSTDNGTSWTAASTGLSGNALSVHALAVSGTNLFAGSDLGGVYLSTDNGTSWTAASTGLSGNALSVRALAVIGTNLFAGTDVGVYLSTDNGTSWTAASTGLLSNARVDAFAMIGTNLFVGTGSGVFRSTNNGTTWSTINTGVLSKYRAWVSTIAASGTNLFAGIRGGAGYVFRSTDSGESWEDVSSGTAAGNDGMWLSVVKAFAVSGNNLFAGGVNPDLKRHEFVFRTSNNGTTWTACKFPVDVKSKKELKAEAAEAARQKKAEAVEAKREAARREKADAILTPDVIENLANHFMSMRDASGNGMYLNMPLGTHFDVMRLYLNANAGSIRTYFEQQFNSVPPFSNTQLDFLSQALGLTYDQSRALRGK